MKEIIHCITTIQLGGAEKQLLTLVEEQVKSGYKVKVIYLKNEPELQYSFEKIGAEVLNFLVGKSIINQILTLRKYLKFKSTILHAHLPRAELFCALTKKNNFLIISKHNSEKFFPKSNSMVSKIIARFVFSRCLVCICISAAVRRYLLDIGEVYECSKLEIVHYGYSKNGMKGLYTLESSKKELGISEFFVFGTIARLVKQKNYEILLESFAKISNSNNQVKLLIVGDGPDKNKVIHYAEKLKILEKIFWVTHTNDVYKFLSAMDVFVLASNYEGFGLVLLEAMQSNTPIIAANNSSIPEVLGATYPGLFETSNSEELETKLRLTFNFNYRKSLTTIYAQRLNLFTPNSMCSKINLIYGKLLTYK
jgi:glycosyltransferase involved in cell wall biosynthesis